VAGILITHYFLYFTDCFLVNKKINRIWPQLRNVVTAIIVVLVIFTNLIINGVSTFPANSVSFGYLYPVYAFFVSFYFFLSFVNLFHNHAFFSRNKGADNSIKVRQLEYIIIATIIPSSIGVLFDIFLPYYGFFELYWFGPAVVIIFVVFNVYAIFKHKLLDIKLITAELFTILIWITTLVHTMLSENTQDQLINGFVFILVTIFGILLLRGMFKEIAQRERIEKLAGELEVANMGQQEFLHFLSHEVKGYFTVVSALYDAILTDPDYGPVSEELRKLVSTGLARNKKAVGDIEDILVSADLQNGKVSYELKPTDAKAALLELVKEMKPEADEKELVLQVAADDGPDYSVMADKKYLFGHAVRNLIENAIIYTEKGEIMITLSRHGGNVTLAVADSGVGLSDDDKTKLFTRGGRGAESGKINAHSTGHGLYITKMIIVAHQGRVWAESAGRGKGSIFFVELPAVNKGAA
ncbi:MAG: hypothetical protein KGJ90_06175, partial [Patescibacteria group bacterium]|nr:hypothetical protein [Patescibacteria group bacterium]